MNKDFNLEKRIQKALKRVNKFIDKKADEELKKSKTERIRIELESGRGSIKEKIIKSNNIESSKKLGGGVIGDAQFVRIEGNGDVVLKPHTRYKEKERIRFANQERATYLISQFIGFDFVPTTVVKKFKDENGNDVIASAQEFVQDAQVAVEVNIDKIPKEELIKLAIFDILIVNRDRSKENFLIKNNKIYAIDHGGDNVLAPDDYTSDGIYGFENYIETDIKTTPIPSHIIKLLKNFMEWKQGQNILVQQLSELMEKEPAKGFVQRIIDFVDCIKEDNLIDVDKFLDYQARARTERFRSYKENN